MSEVLHFDYTNKELVKLILKAERIYEGNWVLAAQLSFSAMNIGQLPDGSDASPAGVVAITGVRLERMPEPLPFSVNAADVNQQQ